MHVGLFAAAHILCYVVKFVPVPAKIKEKLLRNDSDCLFLRARARARSRI